MIASLNFINIYLLCVIIILNIIYLKKKKIEVLLSNLSLHLDEPYITLIIYHHIVINMYMKFFDVHTKNSGLL